MNISECTDIFCNEQALTKLYSGKYLIWQKAGKNLVIKIIIPSKVTQTVHLGESYGFVGVYDWGDGSPKETSTFPWTMTHTYPLSDTDKEYIISIKIDEKYYKEHYTTTVQAFPSGDGDYVKSVYIPVSYTIGCPSIEIHSGANLEKLEFEKDCKLRELKFYNNDTDNKLKELTIPDTVAFCSISNFSQLERMTINFTDGTANEQGLLRISHCTKLKSINVTGAVKRIRFPNCSALERFIVPDCLTEIYKNCFYGCVSLSDVSVPETVTTLGDSCFRNCTALTEIALPSSVKKIGESYGNNPFLGSGLKTIKSVAGSYAETWAKNHGYNFIAI